MPLAKYITEFLALTEGQAYRLVREGRYETEQLKTFLKHETRAAVRDQIDAIINQTEMPLTTVDAKSATVALLDPVAAQINEEYANFEDLEKQATMSMLKIGLLMEHVKEQLPHGQFKRWAEANLTVKYRHAHNFRKLAQVFIAAQQIDSGEMLALVNPENSKKALGDKLRQMAFDFLGDKTQAELFAEYGIQVREKAEAKQLPPPKPKPLKPGETQAHRDAQDLLYPTMDQLKEYIIGDRRIVQHFALAELKTLQGDLIDAKHIVDDLIKAG